MALKLILGPAAGGKTTKLQQEIRRIAESNSEQPIIYLVPEQTTLKVQQAMLQTLKGHSLLGTEILSFNRLAHRIFSETGMPQKKLLDDMGKCMVLYKIARDHQEELIYYGRSVGQKGFIGQLKLMVTELFQYGLDEASLRQIASQQPEGSILAAKLQDIALLWHYFQAYTEEQAIASEAVLDLLAERISRSALVQRAHIFIDDFSGFTPQQYRILANLALRAQSVTMALTITPAAYQIAKSVENWRDLPRQLFFTTEKTVWKLTELAKEYRIPLRVVWQQEDDRPAELTHVNRQLCQPAPEAFSGQACRVRGRAAANQAEELRLVFREIWRLVREEGYAYREIAVVAADLPGYAHGIRRELELYQIPGFLDEKTDLSLNAYVQWVHGLGELIASGFSHESLISVLKTGLSQLSWEELDLLENQALKENWRGKDRVLDGLRRQEAQGQLEIWQGPAGQLADGLAEFERQTKGKRTVQELTEAYRQLARQQQIEQILSGRAQRLAEEGHLLQAMEYERIYQAVDELQQRLCQVMGPVKMDMAEYAAVLDMGIVQSKLGQLPPSLDELLIADLGRSKLSSYRAIFFIGLQEGSFPRLSGASGLLTQAERSQASQKLEMAQGEKEDLMEQYFLLYTAMGKARERLYFFCSRGSGDGKALGQSSLWKRLDQTLGQGWQLTEPEPVPCPLPFLYEEERPNSGAAGTWLMEHGYRRQLDMMAEAKELRQENRPLPAAVARRLMDPSQRLLSVTQLETYARCPFSYYLRYGLYLKEREQPQVRSLEDGNVLHDILQEAGAQISNLLKEDEAQRLARQLAGQKEEEYHVYQTTGRYRYYWKKLQKTAARALQILAAQISQGEFQPVSFEWRFGGGSQGGGPVEVPLESGGVVRLQGKIDRVDLWQDEEQRYIRIIDYKSGYREYSPEELYAGLQLQLPVYLEAGEQFYQAKPAGFFYFHLTPQLQTGQAESQEIEKLLLKAGRLDGLFLNDTEIAAQMDRGLLQEPMVLKARVTKNGVFQKNNQTATPEQFERLKDFTHSKLQELSQKMQAGDIGRQPVLLGQNSACDYCEYRKACPFDRRIPGSEFRRVEKMSSDEFWERLESASLIGKEDGA